MLIPSHFLIPEGDNLSGFDCNIVTLKTANICVCVYSFKHVHVKRKPIVKHNAGRYVRHKEPGSLFIHFASPFSLLTSKASHIPLFFQVPLNALQAKIPFLRECFFFPFKQGENKRGPWSPLATATHGCF